MTTDCYQALAVMHIAKGTLGPQVFWEFYERRTRFLSAKVICDRLESIEERFDQYGARELRRVFDRRARQPLAGALLRQHWPGGIVHVALEDGVVAFKAEEGKEA